MLPDRNLAGGHSSVFDSPRQNETVYGCRNQCTSRCLSEARICRCNPGYKCHRISKSRKNVRWRCCQWFFLCRSLIFECLWISEALRVHDSCTAIPGLYRQPRGIHSDPMLLWEHRQPEQYPCHAV